MSTVLLVQYQHQLPIAQKWQVETILFEGYLYNVVELFLAFSVLCPCSTVISYLVDTIPLWTFCFRLLL